MESIQIFKQDSVQQLNEAKSICVQADKSLSVAYDQLQSREIIRRNITSSLCSFYEGLNAFDTLKKQVLDGITLLEKERSSVVATSTKQLNLLNQILLELRSTEVKLKLDPAFTETRHFLIDYIDENKIEKAISKNKELQKIVDNLLSKDVIDNIQSRLESESETLRRLKNQANDIESHELLTVAQDDIVSDAFEVNFKLEIEIVQILKQLNHQLDLCIQYENTHDSLIFPEIVSFHERSRSYLTILKNNCDVIITNCEIFFSYFETISFFKERIEMDNLHLRGLLNEVIPKYIKDKIEPIKEEMHKCFFSLEEISVAIEVFIEDSGEFINSYYSLILEVDRRLKINHQIQEIVDKFQSELSQLEFTDSVERNKFSNQHAEFLPKDLVDMNMIQTKFPKFQLMYSLEQLPRIDDNLVNTARQKLRR